MYDTYMHTSMFIRHKTYPHRIGKEFVTSIPRVTSTVVPDLYKVLYLLGLIFPLQYGDTLEIHHTCTPQYTVHYDIYVCTLVRKATYVLDNVLVICFVREYETGHRVCATEQLIQDFSLASDFRISSVSNIHPGNVCVRIRIRIRIVADKDRSHRHTGIHTIPCTSDKDQASYFFAYLEDIFKKVQNKFHHLYAAVRSWIHTTSI